MDSSETALDSPFHEGEREIQMRLGIRDKMETFGRRTIRDHLPDQHRNFYVKLPFVLIGSVDDQGRPWASIVAGRPGFMASPDPNTLHVAARPLYGDPLLTTIRAGGNIGLLGIEPSTRRRNRLSGRVSELRADSFTVAVSQAFGNCPQYIQTREIEVLPEIDVVDEPRSVHHSDRLDPATRSLIESADTLFIATAFVGDSDAASHGVDVSHRGGKPGFVRVEDDRTFLFPDFAGNDYFNTIGNISLNPKSGFLFVDFDSGDVAYMTGAAEIVWEGAELKAFVGAERLIRFRIDEVIRVEASVPLRFRFGAYSPMLSHTGSWEQAAATVAADHERNAYYTYEIVDIQPESGSISSFYLRRADGGGLPSYEPGQFLPIRLDVPGQPEPTLRTYTLSEAPGGDTYRLSIKRESSAAVASPHFHDSLTVGDRIEAMAPRGRFTLDTSSTRPVVMLSAGVGITPMIAMTNAIINEGLRTRRFRRSYFIHGTRNSELLAFGEHIRGLAFRHDSLRVHVRFSAPGSDDRLGETHDSEGHVDMELLKQLLPFDDYDFYLCGPPPFMRALYQGLTALGVRGSRIRYEAFGPATVIKPAPDGAASSAGSKPVGVRFARSGIDVEWTRDKGTLLDLAEEAGLDPAFACRSGVCGTCVTKIRGGSIQYVNEPSADRGEDEVLICCSIPRSSSDAATSGETGTVVLDL